VDAMCSIPDLANMTSLKRDLAVIPFGNSPDNNYARMCTIKKRRKNPFFPSTYDERMPRNPLSDPPYALAYNDTSEYDIMNTDWAKRTNHLCQQGALRARHAATGQVLRGTCKLSLSKTRPQTS